MNRRDLLRSLAAALALPGMSGAAADRLLTAPRHAPGAPLRVLDPHQRAIVDTIADLIIPATDTPGARAAQVDAFIDLLLAEWYPADERARFLSGLADVDVRARATYATDFVAATDAQRRELLRTLDAEVQALHRAKQHPEQHFFQRMKFLTLYGYFTSEVGAKSELHYVAIPGGYDPCTPIDNAPAVPGDFW